MNEKKIGGWLDRGKITSMLNARQSYVANHIQRKCGRFVEGRKV